MNRTVPTWLKTVWLMVAIGQIALYFIEVGGDRATSNVLMIGILNLGLLITLVWFLTDSSRSSKLRIAVLTCLVAAAALVAVLFKVQFTGALLPRFDLRFGAPGWDALAPPTGGSRSVDLSRETAFDFPGFLGANRDSRVQGVALATDFETSAPELLWRQPIGPALSGFAVRNGFAATLEQRLKSDDKAIEVVTLYDVDSGDLIWSRTLDSDNAFGNAIFGRGPRSTPTIDDGMVFAQSVHGIVAALDGKSGELLWQLDLREKYGVSPERALELLPYGRPGSPLIRGELLLVPAGGDPNGAIASILALDKRTGEVRFEGGARQISMASPTAGTLLGREQLLMVNEDWVTGHDPETGRELWAFEWEGKSAANASVSQAVAIPPDKVFTSKGYGTGAALWQLTESGGGISATQLWHKARSLRTKFTNIAIKDGYGYGLSEGVLECIEIETGERAWKHGRYGHGQLLLVGEVLLVLTEDGEIVYIEATPERRNNVLARFQAVDGQTWNPFALAGDRLLVRNAQEAAVYRLPLR